MTILRLLLSITFLLIYTNFVAQDNMELYKQKVEEASRLYKSKEFKKSAKAYSIAFAAIGKKAYPTDRYNAACSFALAGEKDSALYHLFRLADGSSKYKKLNHITKDADLNSLHNSQKWDKIIAMVKENKEFSQRFLEPELVTLLDSIFHMDQDILVEQGELAKEFGWESEQVKFLKPRIDSLFKITRRIVSSILDERGWLGPEVVGSKGNSALFLVVQHSDLEMQQKYLPMMRKAAKERKANSSSLALLEDRVNLKLGKKQVYGSQIGRLKDQSNYVRALEDPMNVDQRRAEVGLQPLNDYTQYWNFDFDPVEYLKKLPEYEKILKEQFETK